MFFVYSKVVRGFSRTNEDLALKDTAYCITSGPVLCSDHICHSSLRHQSNSTGHVEHASLKHFVGGIMGNASEGRPERTWWIVIWVALCRPCIHQLCFVPSRWSSARGFWLLGVVEFNIFRGFTAAGGTNIFTGTIRSFVGTLSNNCMCREEEYSLQCLHRHSCR